MKECGIFLGVYFSPQPISHHLYWYAYCVSIGQKIVAEIVAVYNQLDNLGVEITHHRTQIISIQQLLKLSCKKKKKKMPLLSFRPAGACFKPPWTQMVKITEMRHQIKNPETNAYWLQASHIWKRKIFPLSLPVNFKCRHKKDNIYKHVLEWMFNCLQSINFLLHP